MHTLSSVIQLVLLFQLPPKVAIKIRFRPMFCNVLPISVGLADMLGCCDGILVGKPDGMVVGKSDGMMVGKPDGMMVGKPDGIREGICDGCREG